VAAGAFGFLTLIQAINRAANSDPASDCYNLVGIVTLQQNQCSQVPSARMPRGMLAHVENQRYERRNA
jgi:hypothetical protein